MARALARARRLLAPFGDAKPAGIALSGQMQNVVLARAGASLRPCLLYWTCARWRRSASGDDCVGRRTTMPFPLANLGAAACLCKWLWLSRHDAETPRGGALLLGAHSFLAYALCGDRSAAACDAATASTTRLLARRGKRNAGRRRRRPSPGWTPRCSPAARFAPAVGKVPGAAGENAAAAEPRACPCSTAGDLAGATVGAVGGRRPEGGEATRTAARRGGSRACECGAKKRKKRKRKPSLPHDVHVAPPRPETGDRGVDGDRAERSGRAVIPNRKGGAWQRSRRPRTSTRRRRRRLREATAFCSCRTSTASARRSRTPPRASVS